ncbi:hypothetical protein MLP_44380 [Microlunatus phosphovorus NM-1]|uniref:O-antigen ligase-related domain-containing protein n=1 Tax=Microlunatus phosphovorus (strain ATCC 700054 / DSM 10555 / JCM 9379 / NBRC 101784 / NCIMB 13414 / VKM Ac-1990 / NM-1) TaxID=1032480 RepID=F5XTK3_MICPN|nr:O-antigen ligase family protein [Microlunatus phosphovorus]BAK37452.1 hypothetical protein MLP_44380 [Microlunatus phosphovorus NM-1]
MTDRTAESVGAPQSRQTLLCLALVVTGLGNLVMPATVDQFLPINYIALTSFILALAIMVHLRRVAEHVVRTPSLVVFVALTIPGMVAAPLNQYGTTKTVAIALALIMILAASAFRDPRRSTLMTIALIYVLGLLTAAALMLFGQYNIYGRLSLFELNPIGIGRVCALVPIISVGWLLLGRTRSLLRSGLHVAALLLALSAAVATGSRGPLVAAIAGVGVIALVAMRHRGSRVWAIILVGGIVVSVSYVVEHLPRFPGLQRLELASDSGRVDLIQQSLAAFMTHPMGVGWGNLGQYVVGFSRPDRYTFYPHNILIEMAVEGGVLAISGFLLLLITAFIRVLRSTARAIDRRLADCEDGPEDLIAPALVLALLTASVVNAQFSSDIVGNRLLWVMIGLALVSPAFGQGHSFEEKEFRGGFRAHRRRAPQRPSAAIRPHPGRARAPLRRARPRGPQRGHPDDT